MKFTFDFEGKTYAVDADQWGLGFSIEELAMPKSYYAAIDYQFIRSGRRGFDPFWDTFEQAYKENAEKK